MQTALAIRDRVVQAALLACWDWEVTETLPDLLDLYRMYPAADRWSTEAVEHSGGTAATAKKEWLVRFGHPLKQRARPALFASLKRTLEQLTGRTFASTTTPTGPNRADTPASRGIRARGRSSSGATPPTPTNRAAAGAPARRKHGAGRTRFSPHLLHPLHAAPPATTRGRGHQPPGPTPRSRIVNIQDPPSCPARTRGRRSA